MDPPQPEPWTNVPSDILYELSARLPNSTLEVLSQSQHWGSIAKSTKNQDWWRERTEFLVGKSLNQRKGNWAGVYRDIEKYGPQFHESMNYYNDIIVPVLLELGADPSGPKFGLVGTVAACNNVTALKLLLADKRVDPTDYWTSGTVVAQAAAEGSLECLVLLLEDGRFKPQELEDLAIRRAVERYRPEALRLLLNDKRTDPGALDNDAIKTAATRGYTDIFKMLIEDKRVQAVETNSLENDYYLIEAIRGGHVDIVSYAMSKADSPTYYLGYYLEEACVGHSLDMVRLLVDAIKEPDTSVSTIEQALRTGRQDVADILLSVPSMRARYEEYQKRRLG